MTSGITTGTGSPTGVAQAVLLLGPDDDARRALHLMLDRRGLHVAAMSELEAARRYLSGNACDVVIAAADIAAPITAADAWPPVIAVVRPREVAASLALFEAGVHDVVTEPVEELAIAIALRRIAIRPRSLEATAPPSAPVDALAPALPLDAPPAALTLVGDGAAMQQLRAKIALIAAHRTTVLILGESGTGKELVARAIHDASPRRHQKFVAINCAAIPGPLLESELFGHKRGAFTDAVRDKPGLFEDADGGTLFLDEVGELPLALQSKLLRALQESEIRRVGDTETIKIDVRLIAATLRDLAEDLTAGRFREDLYYRLAVLPVRIPPLRERADDIPQLARFFAHRHSARHGRDVTLTDAALAALAEQPWPGNVRELENVIERALVLVDGDSIDLPFLTTVMTLRAGTSPANAPDPAELSIKKATRTLERDLIARALGVTGGNRTNAAKLLEISHRALLYKMKEYGIS